MLIVAIIISGLVLIPIGAYSLIVTSSRSPPFPIAWKTPLSGQRVGGTSINGDVAYLLRLLHFDSLQRSCTFRVISVSVSNGSNLWNSAPINSSGPCLDYANLFYAGTSIYFVDANTTKLYVIEMDSHTGKNLSSTVEPVPGGIAESIFASYFGGNLYVGGIFGLSNLSVEAIHLGLGYSPLWEKSVKIPGKTEQSFSEPVLYVDAQRLAIFESDQGKLFYIDFLSNGDLQYSGYVPGPGFSDWGPSFNDCCGQQVAFLNGSVYYLEGSIVNPRIYGARLSDATLVGNFSAADGVRAYGSVGALYAVGDELLSANSSGVTAFSPAGKVLWSYQVQNEASTNQVYPVALKGGLVFLEEDNSHVYYSPGQLYSGSYALLNSSSGQAFWHHVFEPWVVPPWTDNSLPSYIPLGSGNGFLLFTDGSSLYGVQTQTLVSPSDPWGLAITSTGIAGGIVAVGFLLVRKQKRRRTLSSPSSDLREAPLPIKD
jgi:hypothetical protein